MKTAFPLLLAGLTVGALALSGCVTTPDRKVLYTPCKAIETRDWSAHLEVSKEGKFPFPEEVALVVSGTVTVPTGGFELAIDKGPLVALDPPVQQVLLRTAAPDGMATQAITEERVRGSMPFDKRAKSVAIRCGDATIARIPVIEDRRTPSAQ
ncbi:MAG TPA: hypothetical protein VGB65_09070 [Allosphingosinicella sp.]